jgi:succinate dehydrogenase / fumarate reductase cytochrome b subunit
MYRGQAGQWSWLFHRVTGVGVLLFLLIHIVDITLIGFGRTVYNEGIYIFSLPIVRVASLALIASVLYHALNGVRIMIIDFWPAGYKYQRAMYWAVIVIAVAGFIPMGFFVIAPVFGFCPQGPHGCTPFI